MRLTILLGMCAAVLLGCTTVQTTQTETDPDGYTRETRFKARSFFDSKSELAKARTTMTDKSQGVAVSGLTTEASGSNAVQTLRIVVESAAKAAVP